MLYIILTGAACLVNVALCIVVVYCYVKTSRQQPQQTALPDGDTAQGQE